MGDHGHMTTTSPTVSVNPLGNLFCVSEHHSAESRGAELQQWSRVAPYAGTVEYFETTGMR